MYNFEHFFEHLEYYLQKGRGISVFNADNNLFISLQSKSKIASKNISHKSIRLSSFFSRGSLFLPDQILPDIETKIPDITESSPVLVINQDLSVKDFRRNIELIVNKIIYPAWYYHHSIWFFSYPDKADYLQGEVKSNYVHTNYQDVLNFLILEQFINLLEQVNYQFSSKEFLKLNYDKTIFTPIEEMMREALEKASLEYQPQVKLGRYYVDFLVSYNNQKIIVECDGRDYHNPFKDSERDKVLSLEGYGILHFTGSDIYRDSDGCVEKIKKFNQPSERGYKGIDENLDDSQKEAVSYFTGPIRVLAPAGSGKTKTLINRIINLVKNGVEEKEILALAFNKKASAEMEQRLYNKRVTATEVRTFHSFGYKIIQDCLGWKFDGNGCEAKTRKLLGKAVSRHVKLQPLRNRDPLDPFLAALERVKTDLPLLREVTVEQGDKKIPFEGIFNTYIDLQWEHNFFNYNDMIYLATRLLIDKNLVRKRIQESYRYVLVDEFQDLNKAQLLMLQIISLPENNVFIVGDDDQMIYGWRGADVRHILDFNKKHIISETCTLSTNYRSNKNIVHHSGWLIDHNEEREPKDVKPRDNAEEGIFQVELKDSLLKQAKTAARWIRKLKMEQKFNWSDFAVLYRFHALESTIVLALDSLEIPHSSSHATQDILRTKVGRDVYSYLSVILTNDPESEDLELILKRPNKYLKNSTIGKIKSWDDFLNLPKMKNWKRWRKEKLKDFVSRIKILRRIAMKKDISAMSLLTRLETEIGLIDFYKDQSNLQVELDEASDYVIFEAIKSVSQGFDQVDNFHRYVHECIFEKNKSSNNDDDKDEVVLTTIHSTKGNEYKNVVYFNLSRDEKMEEEEVEEERRVSYVAVTRAEKNILITAQEDDPSIFLKELFYNSEYEDISTNKLVRRKDSARRDVYVLQNKVEKRDEQIESLLNKYPELTGKRKKYSSNAFLNSVVSWLSSWRREKKIEPAKEEINELEEEIDGLNSKISPKSEEIERLNTEIKYRRKLEK